MCAARALLQLRLLPSNAVTTWKRAHLSQRARGTESDTARRVRQQVAAGQGAALRALLAPARGRRAHAQEDGVRAQVVLAHAVAQAELALGGGEHGAACQYLRRGAHGGGDAAAAGASACETRAQAGAAQRRRAPRGAALQQWASNWSPHERSVRAWRSGSLAPCGVGQGGARKAAGAHPALDASLEQTAPPRRARKARNAELVAVKRGQHLVARVVGLTVGARRALLLVLFVLHLSRRAAG